MELLGMFEQNIKHQVIQLLMVVFNIKLVWFVSKLLGILRQRHVSISAIITMCCFLSRVFSASSLQFIGSLPKPHCLGVDVAAGHDAR